MMIEIDDTLEQGRAALNLLERQLHDRKDQESLRSDASYDSRQYSITSERKLLDKVPRDERLKLKKSSPLGLTVEVQLQQHNYGPYSHTIIIVNFTGIR
jgi:hypothetical protein